MKVKGLTLPLLAALCCAPLAHADLVLSYDIYQGGTTGGTLLGSGTCLDIVQANPNASGSCGTVTLNVDGGTVMLDNYSGTAIQIAGDTEQDGASSKAINTSKEEVTVLLTIAANNFSAPVTPPNILDTSSLDWTSTVGTGSTAMESCVDQSNLVTGFCNTPALTITNPAQFFLGPNSGTVNTVKGTITSLSSGYTLSQEVTVVLGAGSGTGNTPGGSANIDTGQVLASVTSVPEPMSIALLGTVILLSSIAIRRKLASKP